MYGKLQGASWKTEPVFSTHEQYVKCEKIHEQRRQNVLSSELFISKVRITVRNNTPSPQKNRDS